MSEVTLGSVFGMLQNCHVLESRHVIETNDMAVGFLFVCSTS